MVISSKVIQEVNVTWCACDGLARDLQLLDEGWWPATVEKPQSCATMECLNQWHILNLAGNLTVYDYMRHLEFLTDNTGLEKQRVRFSGTRMLLYSLTYR